MGILLAVLVLLNILTVTVIVWYFRASSKTFRRDLDRTLWRAWEAGRRRGDNDLPQRKP